MESEMKLPRTHHALMLGLVIFGIGVAIKIPRNELFLTVAVFVAATFLE